MKLLSAFYLVAMLSACGGSTTAGGLQIRPGYTSDTVVSVFQKRYSAGKELPPGPPVVVEETGMAYEGLAQAAEAAGDGGVLILGPGLYRDSISISDKRLTLRGAGLDRTVLLSPETAVLARQGAKVILTGMNLVSWSVRADVAVVAVVGATLEMHDCRVSGATGPGVLVSSGAQAILTGNLLLGNMGGGLMMQGGALQTRRNVFVRNAVAGIVVAPSEPDAIKKIQLWHDVVLDNWAGPRCVSFAKTGVVPLTGKEVVRIEGSVLNTPGLSQTFSEKTFGLISTTGYNYLSNQAVAGPDFVINADLEDFRPKAALKTDELGLELGAYASVAGMSRIRDYMQMAMSNERLRDAFLLATFLPVSERMAAHSVILSTVGNWTAEFLEQGRMGTRLVSVINLAQVAPADWRLDVLLDRFLEGFVSKYTYVLRPLNFFDMQPAVSQAAFQYLGGNLRLFPRFLTLMGESDNAFVLSGAVTVPFKTTVKTEPVKLTAEAENPHLAKVRDTIKVLQNKRAEAEKKAKELRDNLNNPHLQSKVGEDSKYMRDMKKNLTKQEEEVASLTQQIETLQGQLDQAPAKVKVTVSGKKSVVRVTGEFTAQLVAAPAGDILLDTTAPIEFVFTSVEADPVPEWNYPGQKAEPLAVNVDKLVGQEIGRLLLTALVDREADQLKALLERFDDGVISPLEEDQLIELLLLNAVLYRDAIAAKDALSAQAGLPASPSEPTLVVRFDEAKGFGKNSVVVELVVPDSRGPAQGQAAWRTVYEPLWKLQKPIERFVSVRFGFTQEEFFQLRARLDSMARIPDVSQ